MTETSPTPTDSPPPPAAGQISNALIARLAGLLEAGDRGAVARLRHAADLTHPDSVLAVRWLGPFWGSNAYREPNVRLIAELFFSWHRAKNLTIGSGSFGHTLRQLAAEAGQDSVERRFERLLRSHVDDLPNQLRGLVGLLRAHNVPVDWQRLEADLNGWSHPERYVQRRWADDFYRTQADTPPTTADKDND